MSETNTKYPWRNIVKFYKDIVELDQKDVFEFQLDKTGQLDPSRCALLNHFSPDSLEGSWDIPVENLESTPLLTEIKEGKLTEGYIGGPCWVGWDPQTKLSYLSPLLYQQVQIHWNDEENAVTIIPIEGRWDMPPFLFDKLDRLEYSSDIPLEELPFRIIEQASLKSEKDNKPLSEYIVSETISCVPVFSDLFSPKYPPKMYTAHPNPWVFFTFPSQAGLISKHLIPDYETLERSLREDPENIGGFKIFENLLDPEAYKHSDIAVDPIIPLNPSQEAAVRGVLDKKPITVISGPPGCGKSQVVVSLILNAWAQGKSVLFSSNTKAAVNVVFGRLKDFECEYPIAIRAGAKEQNTIKDSLDKLRYLTITKAPSQQEMEAIEYVISGLYAEKQELQRFIDDKIPQRITQAKQTAWKSYLQVLEINKEIEQYRAPYCKKIAAIGYDHISPESFSAEVYLPLKKWLESIEHCRYQIQSDDQQRKGHQSTISGLEEERNQALRNLGYNPASDMAWLAEGPGVEAFEQWLNKYRDLLDEDAERLFSTELKTDHRQWSGENDARSWTDGAQRLQKEINAFFSSYSDRMGEYQALKGRYEDAARDLKRARLPEELPFEPALLGQWKNEYLHNLTLPGGLMAIMKRRASENLLQQYESGFRSYFPADVWSGFAQNPEEGRKKLSGLVDQVVQWSLIQKEWEDFDPDKKQIEDGLEGIKGQARILGRKRSLPAVTDKASLLELSREIEIVRPVAQEAADAWKTYEKQEKLREELKKQALQFDALVTRSPILGKWLGEQGYKFKDVIDGLKGHPGLDQIAAARVYCSDQQFSPLINAWNMAIDRQKQIKTYRSLQDGIPSNEKRIADWWNEKPRNCAVERFDRSTLPEDGDVLFQHLRDCERIRNEWAEFAQGDLAGMMLQKKEFSDRAIENLNVAYENIPVSMRTPDITRVLFPLISQSGEDLRWYSREEESVFNTFNPERIQAKIAHLNSRLGERSFALAKLKYLQRIDSGSRVLEDLDDLHRYLNSHNYRANGFPRDKYINALKAAPVWMTNAHQPQSFPMLPEVFDVLIIDEASQCTLSNMLPLIYRAKSLAVIGDPEQLPAIINIKPGKEKIIAARNDMMDHLGAFGQSDETSTMFNLGLKFLPGGRKNMIHLVEHYRSHPLIIGFSNLYIYQMRLSLRRDAVRSSNNLPSGVFGLDVRGTCKRQGKSWANPKEAEQVCSVIEDILKTDELMNKSIGVVTPFKPQKQAIEENLEKRGIVAKDILVDTVDVFQGSERDIIIFSPVISKGISPGTAAWADDKNRINVALTRARDLLVVVGDFEYCRRQDKILGNLIEYVEKVSALRDTSLEELELFSLMLMEGSDLKITRNNLPRIHQRVGAIEVDFILRNPEKGVDVVIEVDGKQHYYVEIDGSKYPVKYQGMQRYVEHNGAKCPLYVVGREEFVEIDGVTHPVVQTPESVVHDRIRDEFLRSEGYKVFRVHTQDIRDKPAVVMNDLKKVLEIIE